MRIIKFKAKDLKTKEWVYGNLIEHEDILDRSKKYYYIESYTGEDRYEVDPNTICQFIGLLDKNKKEIYDKDYLSDGDLTIRVYWNENEAKFSNGIASWREIPSYILEVVGNAND